MWGAQAGGRMYCHLCVSTRNCSSAAFRAVGVRPSDLDKSWAFRTGSTPSGFCVPTVGRWPMASGSGFPAQGHANTCRVAPSLGARLALVAHRLGQMFRFAGGREACWSLDSVWTSPSMAHALMESWSEEYKVGLSPKGTIVQWLPLAKALVRSRLPLCIGLVRRHTH